MAGKKKINYDKYSAGLFTRTEQYADKVRQHFADAVNELLKLTATGDLGVSGAFSFSDSSKLSNEANAILRGLYASVYQEIKGGVQSEWEYANLSCDALIESIFGKGLKEDNHFARWFSRNQDAMDSFFKRKSAYGGLNLSQKVLRYVGNLKTEMEVALSVSLGQGDSAATVSRKVREYLQEPDKMFRRFRVKTGEKDILDADGNVIGKEPIYGRRWKRKVIDPQTGAVTWENFNPRNYHPGQGVYRSSYKNAMRLTRTETNMAYRAADQDRWQRMDFVVGYRVCLSNNHPAPDICNDLSAPRDDRKSDRGVYPKDFVFKGWHPQCRCYVIPILASDDDFIAMEQAKLQGKEPPTPKGIIRKPNQAFFDWIEANKERMETATNMPYWVQDNQDYITGKKGQKRVKTDAEREAIRKAWAERAKKNQQALKTAGYVARYAADYPEIDLTNLQAYIAAKNVARAQAEAKAVAKQVAAVHKDEVALGKLIPDVHTWKQQFTSTELHGVYDAVEKKLAGWSSLTLEQQKKKLHFEAVDFLGGNMHGVQSKYKTWKVSQAAYLKKEAEVIDAIDWQNIDKVLQEAKTFKTKSQPYLDLISQLETAISSKNKADAQNIVADMQAKRQALAKAAAARTKKKGGSVSGSLSVTRLDDENTLKVGQAMLDKPKSSWDKGLVSDLQGAVNAHDANKVRNIAAKLKVNLDDSYNEYRKNAAMWAKDTKEADDVLRDKCGEVWRSAPQKEREAIYQYTRSFHNINEPLRGLTYYGSKADTQAGLRRIPLIESIIDKSSYEHDMWLQRGDDMVALKKFGLANYNYATDAEIKSLVGAVGTEGAYWSCSVAKGKGLDGNIIFNIYAPKGTKGMYCEPFSAFGNGARSSHWDGLAKQSSFGYESEILLQRGTTFRITKVEKSSGTWYIDLEVIEQKPLPFPYVGGYPYK